MQLVMLEPRDKRFLSMCMVELGLGLVAIVAGWIIGFDPRSLVPDWRDWYSIGEGLVVGCVAGVVLVFVMLILALVPLRSIQSLNEHAERQLRLLLSGLSVAQLIAVSLAAGVGEELLFRGLVMQWLIGDMQSCTTQSLIFGIIVSALVFGLAHPMSIAYVVFAFFMGLAMGVLHWYFQNLLVPIVAHWVYDAIMMVWLVNRTNSTIT
jgi:membrane protease YdiL (CAAX protease family)